MCVSETVIIRDVVESSVIIFILCGLGRLHCCYSEIHLSINIKASVSLLLPRYLA